MILIIIVIVMQEIITAGHYQNLYPNPCKHVCIIKLATCISLSVF